MNGKSPRVRTDAKGAIEPCIIDLEATGLDTAMDRIVSLTAWRPIREDDGPKMLEVFCNPGVYMSDEIVNIHGITNEEAQRQRPFKDHAEQIFEFIKGTMLVGYNLIYFDIPMLWEEFSRAGLLWEDAHETPMLDVGNIFKKREERTLSAAMKFYCGREHVTAHTSRGDVEATWEVFQAQMLRYPDLNNLDIQDVIEYSQMELLDGYKRVDLSGKILLDRQGEYVFGLRTKQGVRIADDTGFAEWMLGKDFSQNTKWHLRRILWEIEQKRQATSTALYQSGSLPF